MTATPTEIEPVIEPEPAAARFRNWRDPRTLATLAVAAVSLVFILVRLGPALFGAKVFGAFDLLSQLDPWSNGLPKPPPTNGMLTDSLDAAVPGYSQIRDGISAGNLPLWTSLSGPGNGLMTNTSRPTLTPTTVWFLALPTSYALGFAKLAEVLIAVTGMTLWLRRVGTSTAAGMLAGLIYCGTGFIVGWSTWTAQAGVAAMIPALFWVLERYLQLRTIRSTLPIAAVVAFLLLAGFPAAAGHAFYAGGLYFLVRLIADRREHPLRDNLVTLGGGVVGLVVGGMISAVQFLPLISRLSDTDLSYRTNQFFVELPDRAALTTVFPGSLFKIGYGGLNQVEAFAYLGVAAMVLALVALITPRRRVIKAGVVSFLGAGVLVVASLLWFQGFWTEWLSEFPIFKSNLSVRFRDLLSLFVCALAGIGAHQVFLVARTSRMRRSTLWALAASAALLLLVTVRTSDAFREKIDLKSLFAEFSVGLVIIGAVLLAALTGRRAARAGLFAVVAVLAMVQVGQSVSNYWPLSDKDQYFPKLAVMDSLKQATGDGRTLQLGPTLRGSTAAVYGIRSAVGHAFQPEVWKDLLLAMDKKAMSLPSGSQTNPVVAMSTTPGPGVAAMLDRMSVSTFFTTARTTVPGPTMLLDGTPEPAAGIKLGSVLRVLPTAPQVTTLTPQAVRAVFVHIQGPVPGGDDGQITMGAAVTDAAGTLVAGGQITVPALNEGAVQIPVAGENLADLTGPLTLSVTADQAIDVGGFADGTVAARVTGDPGDGVDLVAADPHGQVWQRPNSMSRIRWAGTAEVIQDSKANLARLQDPALPDSTVLLSEPGPLGGGGTAALQVTEDTGQRVSVTVDAATDGYLVVADWMEKGWKVTIDGASADLVLADHAFGGVHLPAGRHQVTFAYSGQGLGTGLAVTGLGLAGFAFLALLPWLIGLVRRRRGGLVVTAASPETGAAAPAADESGTDPKA